MRKIKNKKTGEVKLVKDSELELYGIKLPEAKNGIYIDKSKRGTFKTQASKMGMPVQEAASKILNAPEGKYSPAMRKKANFAKNFAKENGGYLPMYNTGGNYPIVGGDLQNQPYSDFGLGMQDWLYNLSNQYYNSTEEPIITERPQEQGFTMNPMGIDPLTGRITERLETKPLEFSKTATPINKPFSMGSGNMANTQGGSSYLNTINRGIQNLPNAIKEAQKGNYAALTSADISPYVLAGAISEQIGAKRTNTRLQKNITNQFRDAQTMNYLQDYNDDQWGNPNVKLAAYGGGFGIPSKFEGNSHANGGIPVNFNSPINNANDAKVPRNLATLEVENNEYHLPSFEHGGLQENEIILSRNNKIKVEAANGKMVNPSEKLDIDSKAMFGITPNQLNKKLNKTEKLKEKNPFVFSNNVAKDTQELQALLLQPIKEGMHMLGQEAYTAQEVSKYNKGIPNDIIGNNEAKYGGMKKAQNGTGNTFTGINPNIDWKTLRLQETEKQRRNKFLPFGKNELPQGYGSQLGLESVFTDFENSYGVKLPQGANEQKLQALREYQTKLTPELTKDYKLNFARGNEALYSEYKKSKGYKKSKDNVAESQNFYDWAKNSGKLTEDYANKGLWGHEYYNTSPLNFSNDEEYNKWMQDPDWVKVGNYYVDRSADPNQPITYYKINKPAKQKEVKKSDVPESVNPLTLTPEKGKVGNFGAFPVIQPFNEPYLESPVNRFTFNPNLVDYRDLHPDFTEISRDFRLSRTGNPKVDANLFAQTLNAKNQQLSQINNANKQGRMQVDQFNAGVLNNIQSQQYGENAQFRDLVGRMRGALSTQKLLDRNTANVDARKQMDYYNFTLPTLQNLYSTPDQPFYQADFSTIFNNPNVSTPKTGKKYGGRIKMKKSAK